MLLLNLRDKQEQKDKPLAELVANTVTFISQRFLWLGLFATWS